MPDIQRAYNYVVSACNNSHVGYSQKFRNKRTVNGITYYDCSSLMWYGAQAGGFNVEQAYLTATGHAYSGNAITTPNERDWLLAMGFVEVPLSGQWLAGDVLWKSGHTEMVYEGGNAEGRTMGAHTSEVSLANQVSIYSWAEMHARNNYLINRWTHMYRYLGSTPLDWIKGNRYLNQSEMENNATIIYSTLYSYGWSYNVICAVLGNMQVESTINPGIWQSLNPNPNLGWGLVQWTPSTNYTDWADANGYAHDDGYGQLEWIENETVPFGQWIPTANYPISFADFKVSNESVDYLTRAFCANFERAGSPDYATRVANAEYWYDYLQNVNPFNPSPSERIKHMPVWMMLRRF